MDALHAPLDLRAPAVATCPSSCGARAPTSGTTAASGTWTGWPGCSSSRSATAARSSRRRPPSRQRAGVLPAVVLRPPAGHRAGRPPRRLGPGRPEQGLLHDRRRRGRRDGLEARQAVLQADRQAQEAQGDQPGDRVSRHPPGRALDHRHPGREGDVRAARPRRVQGARTPTSTARPSTATTSRRSAAGRPTGSRRRSCSRAGHGRGGVPRAGAELRWLLPAAARLLPAGPRDLRRARRAARLGRGDLRVRPARHDVRVDEFGYQPDIITCAKGMTSGYSPIGAMIASDRLVEPFRTGRRTSRTATPSAGIRSPPPSPWPTSTSSSARA